MKRKIALGMMIGLMVCFCGCGSKDEYASSDTMYGASDEYYASIETPANGVYDVNDPVECDSAPSLDISGCETFTDIVDKAMLDDMGYANVTIAGEDLLLVCSRTVEEGGIPVALNCTAYRYVDGKPVESGCAYSTKGLRLGGDYLYSGSDSDMSCFTMEDGTITGCEYAWAYEYAENEGDPEVMHYFYDPCNGEDDDCETDEATFKKALEKFNKATPIEFSVVHR